MRLRLIALVAATLTVSACLDDPAVRERLGVDEQGRPIGPSPGAAPATPAPSGAPASPTPSPSPSPTETPRSPSASPSAAAVAPGVTGSYRKTFDPLDLAIAGPGYFVLATRPDPRGFEELLFTRTGQFDLVYVAAGSPAPGVPTVVGPGEWRLMTPEGLYVLGYQYRGEEAAMPPSETRSMSFQSAFRMGGTASVGPILIDSQSNLNFAPHFNFKGQLLSDQKPPMDTDATPLQVYVAIAQFERPAALKPRPGFPAFTYDADVGVV
ncbi:MAG: hypothetical protein ACK46X_21450, partial [Candidatus Sericytochromatia bacterium]